MGLNLAVIRSTCCVVVVGAVVLPLPPHRDAPTPPGRARLTSAAMVPAAMAQMSADSLNPNVAAASTYAAPAVCQLVLALAAHT